MNSKSIAYVPSNGRCVSCEMGILDGSMNEGTWIVLPKNSRCGCCSCSCIVIESLYPLL